MRQTKSWTLHVAAGLILLLLLGSHMTIMHLDSVTGGFGSENADDKPISWENVSHRGKHILMAVFYILFLGIALFHGLFGSRTILLETDFGARNKKMITTVITVVGFGLFIFGSAAAIKFVFLTRADLMIMGG